MIRARPILIAALAVSASRCTREGPGAADRPDSTPPPPMAEVRGPVDSLPAPRRSGPPAERPDQIQGAPDDQSPGDSAWSSFSDSARTLAQSALQPGRTFRDTLSLTAAIRKGMRHPGWRPPNSEPVPGALLPARRIVAFYGNPLSTRMGILGQLPPDEMLTRLDSVVAEWQRADPATAVQPALHLIAVVAQEKPGSDSLYRLRMDTTLIARVYDWARSRQAILFLDIQAGASTIQQELPRLLPWLGRPEVHLGIDPEFYMHYESRGHRPGTRIGTLTAAEVNHAIEVLAGLVAELGIPPKVLVIHRFTVNMLQKVSAIRLDPRVQVVINMDGWGQPWLKFDSYAKALIAEPVQFTGFKLFFRHDTRAGDPLLSPSELLGLRPRPVYIQYQ